MSLSTLRVDAAGPRDWPSLREVTLRTDVAQGCLGLAAAVAESPRPVDAWKQRMEGLCGADSLTLFVRDTDGVVLAMVSAYVDGDLDERIIVLRHLFTTPESGLDVAQLLLGRVEAWAWGQAASEVLAETEHGDTVLPDVLRACEYAPVGATRSSCAGILTSHHHMGSATEWRRQVSRARRSVSLPIFELAS